MAFTMILCVNVDKILYRLSFMKDSVVSNNECVCSFHLLIILLTILSVS